MVIVEYEFLDGCRMTKNVRAFCRLSEKSAIANAKDILLRHSTEAFVVTCEEDVKYCFDVKKDGCDDKNV